MKKFYHTVICVEVLSDGPIGEPDLDALHAMITDGDCSGRVSKKSERAVSGKKMVLLCNKQGTDPGFFGLDESGGDY